MNLKHLSLLLVAALIVGCKSGDAPATTDSGAGTSTTTTKSTSTAPADDSAKTDTTAAAQNSVVGKWTTDNKEMKDVTYEFTKDGTATIDGSLPTKKGGSITLHAEATYKVDGNKIVITGKSAKLTAPEGADATTKSQVDEQNKMFEKSADTTKTDTSTIEWKDKDTFTTKNDKGEVTTYTRKA